MSTTRHPLLQALLLFSGLGLLRFLALFAMNPNHAVAYLGKWDGEQYAAIARFGYLSADGIQGPDPEVYTQRLAFFPGFPALIRAVYWPLQWLPGITYVGVGVAIACVAGVIATWGMIRLGGGSKPALLLLGAPMAITMTMAYTESLFLACALWALVCLREDRFATAALLTAAAGLVRLTAVDLWLVLAVYVVLYKRRQLKAWLILGAAAVPLASFLVWASWLSRDFGGYFGLQQLGWHSGFDFGAATWEWVSTAHTNPGYILSTAVILAAAASVPLAAWWVYRGQLHWTVWLFGAAIIANVLLSDGIMHSRPRLLLPAIVLLLPLAKRLPYWALAVWFCVGTLCSAYMVGVFEWAI